MVVKSISDFFKQKKFGDFKSCKKNDICYLKHLRDLASSPEILYYVGDIAACDTDELMEFVGQPEYVQMSLFG